MEIEIRFTKLLKKIVISRTRKILFSSLQKFDYKINIKTNALLIFIEILNLSEFQNWE